MMSSKNPYTKYESVFENWPRVQAWTVNSEHGLRVAGMHDTPTRRKTADRLSILAAIFWAVLIGSALYSQMFRIEDNPGPWMTAGFALWAFLSFLTPLPILSRAEKTTIVMFSPSFIQFGEKTYDAKIQHKFSMDVHRQAKEEADAELRAQQRGKGQATIRHSKYYRESFHIYFEYLGQKILVTDIHKPEPAEKLLRALNAVDKIIHNEKSVFSGKMNDDESAAGTTDARQVGYFGTRPALD